MKETGDSRRRCGCSGRRVATKVATGPQGGQGAEAHGHRVSGWEREGVNPERRVWEKRKDNSKFKWERVASKKREKEERAEANRALQRIAHERERVQQPREKGRDENRGSERKEEGDRERVEGHGECMAALLCGYGCEPCGCKGCEGGDRQGSSYPDPDTDPNPNPSPNPKPQSVTVDESVAVVDSGSVDNSPASQGLLFPIEAIKSKGSQREIPTCPDSDSVGYDRLTCISDWEAAAQRLSTEFATPQKRGS